MKQLDIYIDSLKHEMPIDIGRRLSKKTLKWTVPTSVVSLHFSYLLLAYTQARANLLYHNKDVA